MSFREAMSKAGMQRRENGFAHTQNDDDCSDRESQEEEQSEQLGVHDNESMRDREVSQEEQQSDK